MYLTSWFRLTQINNLTWELCLQCFVFVLFFWTENKKEIKITLLDIFFLPPRFQLNQKSIKINQNNIIDLCILIWLNYIALKKQKQIMWIAISRWWNHNLSILVMTCHFFCSSWYDLSTISFLLSISYEYVVSWIRFLAHPFEHVG